MRVFSSLVVLAFVSSSAFAIEESDVLFFAPFEGQFRAKRSEGNPLSKVTGKPQFAKGVRGQAARLGPDAILTFPFHRNVVADEGTIVMWAKPEWPMDDGKFHYFFRASTGGHGGKALNAIMLYKYLRDARVLFYTSNGLKTSPSEGRTLTSRANVKWPVGEWMHLAVTWSATLEGTEMWLYLNGQRVAASRRAVFTPDEEPATFDLGGPVGAGATWLDDVMVFHRPLSQREVAALYQSYAKGRVAQADELPFVPSQALEIEPYVNFGRGQLRVHVDYRAARKQMAGQPGRLRVEVAGPDGSPKREVAAPVQGVALVALDYADVGPGERRIRVVLTSSKGAILRQGEVAYTVPAKPVWLGNDLGRSRAIPPPWTPVKVEGDTVETWGRRYVFAGSPLPSQITSQGRALLRGPVSLCLETAGKAYALAMRAAGGFDNSGSSARRSWTGRLGPLDCVATALAEFDGFVRIDLTLTPRRETSMRLLELRVPMKPQAATLYHHANCSWSNLSEAGGVGAKGWRKALAFAPYVWLGNEAAGLAWVCEHNNNWRNADENRAIEMRHTNDGVDLRLRLCDVETSVAEPLRFSFGFLATPAKPLPKGWRNWRQAFLSAQDLAAYVRARPANPKFRNIGVLYNNHVGAFSYLPADPPEMKRKVAFLRGHGWQTVVSYMALDFTQKNTPEYVMMEREWRRNPFSQNATAGAVKMPYASVCNNSSWADFLVWAIGRTMDQTGTDGVYLDCSNPNFCRSAEHGCAPGKFSIFATRELQKRIYTLVKRKRGEKGFVYSHNSENNVLTTFSFSDAVLNGEQYNKKDLRTLTREKFRAEFLPYPSGLPNFLLPTLTKRQPNRKEKMPGPEFLAFPLLHDVICVGSWVSPETRRLLLKIRVAMNDFGVADAEFLPYWANRAEVLASPDGAVVSAYLRRDGRAALFIAQGPAAAATFELALRGRLAALRGLPARDALTGDKRTWREGRLVWPRLGRGVQLVEVGTKPEG